MLCGPLPSRVSRVHVVPSTKCVHDIPPKPQSVNGVNSSPNYSGIYAVGICHMMLENMTFQPLSTVGAGNRWRFMSTVGAGGPSSASWDAPIVVSMDEYRIACAIVEP